MINFILKDKTGKTIATLSSPHGLPRVGEILKLNSGLSWYTVTQIRRAFYYNDKETGTPVVEVQLNDN